MCKFPVLLVRVVWLTLLLIAALSPKPLLSAPMVDLGTNGMSDIWEYKFEAVGLVPDADSDGDGADNHRESIAGTNPLDASSAPRITTGFHKGPVFSVTFPSVTGVSYQLQGTTTLTGGSWQVEDSVSAEGAATTIFGKADAEAKFFRVAIIGAGVTNSPPLITACAHSGPTFTVSMPGVAGKYYELQSVTTAGSTNWITETSVVAQVSATLLLSGNANEVEKFFRVAISDLDADTDGLSDWEERQIGTDPQNASSNGKVDENGELFADLDFATNRLASQNVITIHPSGPTAIQPDSGQPAPAAGAFTVTRGGFPLNDLTVNLAIAAPAPGVAVEGLDHAALTRPVELPAGTGLQSIPVVPLANTNRLSPVVASMRVTSGAGYAIGTFSNASVVIYPSPTPTGTGLTAQYWDNAHSNYVNAANFSGTNVSKVDPKIDFQWGTNAPVPGIANTTFTVRWTGQIQPQYSEPYVFIVRTDDGSKLWVNDQLIHNDWRYKSASDVASATIALQAGVRYNIKLEYYQNTGSAEARLYWYSPSQPKQIIPTARLYPTSVPTAPTSITAPLKVYAFLGQYFSNAVTAANSPLGYIASGLPPGLSFNATNGAITGVPMLAGLFSVSLTASNAVGVGASELELEVLDTGSAVTREVWLGVTGTNVTDIPVGTTPTSSTAWGMLEGVTDFGDDYAERIRGYITAPASGNYYFWLAGSDAAELWISNDGEAVNKVRRARVVPGGTGSQQWNLQSQQRSPWLALEAGERYYVEVLHKAGTGAGDNWSVGWRFDATGTNTLPSSLVPGYVLSRHFDTPPAIIPGTLYSANLLAQPGAISSGVGTATLRVSADETHAVLKYSYSGLTGPITSQHIHSEPYLAFPSTILFDIDDATPEPDGSMVWEIEPAGALSVADIREIIRSGKTYINLHTAAYPAGEIKGNFTATEGSQSFTPPPVPPAWPDDHATTAAAARFLNQATFGSSSNEIVAVQSLGYEGWIDNQFSLPISAHLPIVHQKRSADPTTPYPGILTFNTWWQQSVSAPDQLRQRVAFALSEIMVVSEVGVLDNRATALSSYYDTLLTHSFGNCRELLEAVTLHPAMGLYLDMRRNPKGDIIAGTHPNENYAREILQLFSVGLYRMWPDGTLVMNSQGNLVPTYGQDEILGFARVFTGWNYYQTNQANGRLPSNWNPAANFTNAMVLVPTQHELGTKRVLDNVMLPQAWGNEATSANASYDNYGPRDLELSHDSIFYNENFGPYICRQLIQRLVTSHPTRDYVYRVVQKFNDNGTGVRGDMKAVIKAILLDYQARSSIAAVEPAFGKQREPLLRVTAPARAFAAPPPVSGTYMQSGTPFIAITTASPHRLNNDDDPFCGFTDTSGNPAPPSQRYGNISGSTLTTFNVPAPGLSTGTYGQSGSVITVTNTGHGLGVSNSVHLTFTTGGAVNGVYLVESVLSTARFTVAAADSATRSGSCFFPKWTGGGYVQTSNNVIFNLTLAHGLNIGDAVYVNFNQVNSPADGIYAVTATNNPTQFSISVTNSANRTQNGQTIYPLVPTLLNRSGNVEVRYNSWEMNATDTGNTANLSQTPLNSPTVFNYFFPDYKFQGILASAGLTTPEFQLTSDTEVILQMNFLTLGVLGNPGNTNGLSSYNSGNGGITLDLKPWMTPAYTANAGLPGLVDQLNTLLCAGQLSANARTTIVNYASTLSYTTPTPTQMRDRVRAVVHLIISSPEFTIQR
jgi:hypothetical protein